ncbi:hypothetical protein [Endozoicomonas sp. SESOKO1]|uniref:hypothetical protein n=1 Tax=Endozoicomonas sp. SESOKO1 TaxID=2828742 RepID=UPI002147DDB9|nr:hypothetical protein [Endozoicomonas sp. SESOKO1]
MPMVIASVLMTVVAIIQSIKAVIDYDIPREKEPRYKRHLNKIEAHSRSFSH